MQERVGVSCSPSLAQAAIHRGSISEPLPFSWARAGVILHCRRHRSQNFPSLTNPHTHTVVVVLWQLQWSAHWSSVWPRKLRRLPQTADRSVDLLPPSLNWKFLLCVYKMWCIAMPLLITRRCCCHLCHSVIIHVGCSKPTEMSLTSFIECYCFFFFFSFFLSSSRRELQLWWWL